MRKNRLPGRLVAPAIFFVATGFTTHASADEPDVKEERPRWKVSAETDVVRLALGSLSFHAMVRPAPLPRLRIGLARLGGELPKIFHTLFDPNENWRVEEQGGAASAFFHFRDAGSTFFVGGYVRFSHWEWRREEIVGRASGSQLFVMPSAGYRWFPTESGFFVTPWIGLGVSVWNSGPGKVGPHTYEPLRLFPIPAIHVGYEF